MDITKKMFFSVALSFRGLVHAADVNGDIYCIYKQCTQLLHSRPSEIPHGVTPTRMVCSNCDRFLFVVYGFNWLVWFDYINKSSFAISIPSDEFILGVDATEYGKVGIMTEHTLRRYNSTSRMLEQIQETKHLPFTKQPPFTKSNQLWVFETCTVVQGRDAWLMCVWVYHNGTEEKCQSFDCDPNNDATTKSPPHSVVKHDELLYVATENAVYVFDMNQAEFKPIYVHSCRSLVSFGIFDQTFNLAIDEPYVCWVYDSEFEASVYCQSLEKFQNETSDDSSKKLIVNCNVSEGERVLCLSEYVVPLLRGSIIAIVSNDENSVRLIKVKNQEVLDERVVNDVKCVVPDTFGDTWQGISDGIFKFI